MNVLRFSEYSRVLASLLLVALVSGCGLTEESGSGDSTGNPTLPDNSPLPGPSNSAPQVRITSPASGASFAEGEDVYLSADAWDPEDLDLLDAVTWKSSVDGNVGDGARGVVVALSAGRHNLTAKVTDSAGWTNTHTVVVTVQSASPAENTMPDVSITVTGDSSVAEGSPIVLAASAADAEDGDISDNLRWTSSVDGALSVTGADFNEVLSVGTHTITATVTDSGNMTGLNAVLVIITPGDLVANASYVDRNHSDASDSNPGTEDKPWRTVVHAARTATAGETVYIKAGIYSDGDAIVANSGEPGQEIVFSAYPGDERLAVLYGASFIIRGKSHIKATGLKLENVSKEGFMVIGGDPSGPPMENITLSGNHTYDTFGSAISVWGTPHGQDPGNFYNIVGLLIEDNLIEKANNGGFNECITIAHGVINAVVRYNEVTNGGDPINGGEGIDFKDGVRDSEIHDNYIHGLTRRAIYVDGGRTAGSVTSNIHIYNNLVVSDPGDAIMVGSEGVGDVDGIFIYNNLVLGSDRNGIVVYQHPLGAGISSIKKVAIVNNTVVNGGREGIGWGNIRINHVEAQNLIVRNNIATNGNGFDIKVNSSTIVDKNLCRESFCEVQADPMFVNPTLDPATADYRLQENSPAIDQGSADEAPALDFDGTARTQGAAHDIGAFEYIP